MSSVDLALLGLKYLSLWFERAMGTRNAILYFLITFLRADYGPTFTQRNHHADALTQLWTVSPRSKQAPLHLCLERRVGENQRRVLA